MIQVINDIIDFTQANLEEVKIRAEETNIRELIKQVISIQELKTTLRGLDLQVNIAEDIPEMINSCPKRLKQIMTSLITNAIKFTFMGSVKVVLKAIPNENSIGFEIKDTGIGMKPS